jgi:hypothetical protein
MIYQNIKKLYFDNLGFFKFFSIPLQLCSIRDQAMINASFQHFELLGSENFDI